jgi:hypothetical protein
MWQARCAVARRRGRLSRKTVRGAELLVRIEKVLERAGKLRQVLEVGPLTINLLERSVRQNGEEILLKPMEFDLLVSSRKTKTSHSRGAAAPRRLGRGLSG